MAHNTSRLFCLQHCQDCFVSNIVSHQCLQFPIQLKYDDRYRRNRHNSTAIRRVPYPATGSVSSAAAATATGLHSRGLSASATGIYSSTSAASWNDNYNYFGKSKVSIVRGIVGLRKIHLSTVWEFGVFGYRTPTNFFCETYCATRLYVIVNSPITLLVIHICGGVI